MNERLQTVLLGLFQKLPERGRLAVVHAVAPSFSVGTLCVIERNDGARLFIRNSYRRHWGLPGGLTNRGEEMPDTARREVREEVALAIEIFGEPAVVVDPHTRRVDVIFAARPAVGVNPASVRAQPPEVLECRWFGPDELPRLEPEAVSALAALARQQGQGRV